jgi:hypothetical protein
MREMKIEPAEGAAYVLSVDGCKLPGKYMWTGKTLELIEDTE